MNRTLSIGFVGMLMAAAVSGGCAAKGTIAAGPDYGRPLAPGASALRLITDPARLPDLEAAYDRSQDYDQFLLSAIDRSITWFEAPSSRQFYPFPVDRDEITFEQARSSVAAFRNLLRSTPDAGTFARELTERFDIYESVGFNGQGTVLYTGYYAPVFEASRTRTPEFRVPLYFRPDHLVTDPTTGEPRGRQTESGEIVPYYTRREIEDQQLLAGNELVWLRDELSAYIVHVNGSAKLRLPDGLTMFVGYSGKTDRPYYGLGQSMLDEGLLTANTLTLPAIKQHFRAHPAEVIDLMYRNESYVFFTDYESNRWPAGSLGVRVTEETSLATDKRIFPRGGMVLVDTEAVTLSYDKRPFLHFMLDQDTGGAIKAPGRADIFMGTGRMAEILAGGQYAEGRLYYFFLKPEYVNAGEALAASD